MSKVVCNKKEGCTKRCEREFREPNFEDWEYQDKRIIIGERAFLVAPNDIVGVDGRKFWSFNDALQISQQIYEKNGWRLPTPVEMQLLANMAAHKAGEAEVSTKRLIEAYNFELGGFGRTSDECSEFYVHCEEAGEVGIYWTNTMKTWPETNVFRVPSAMVYQLKYGIGFLTSALIEEVTASVRLVRDVIL